ncbi:MAG: DNA-binding protein [Methanomassiliicoccaceae archaeon]|jgi:predicted DNA-binding protein with PD1-like motif|nr:DNA-binding protein [Methanomassiliicoccaceae archaeon]
MRYSECSEGRVFILRLEEGEILHETVESFASVNKISAATVIAVGGADKGSRLIVGPRVPVSSPVVPLSYELDAPHELTGTGTIFPNAAGRPIMHMHCSCGREGKAVTGCARAGIKVWLVMEVVITELSGCKAKRLIDRDSGFELLVPDAE